MQLTGAIHEIGQTQEVSDKFKKRDLVVMCAENPQYPEYIKLEAHQDKTGLLDTMSIGDTVTVDFNLRGRPWTNKEGVTQYFNTLAIWNINNDAAGVAQPANVPATAPDQEPPF